MAKTEINVKRDDRENVKKTHFQSAFKYYKSSWFCSFFFNAVFLGFFLFIQIGSLSRAEILRNIYQYTCLHLSDSFTLSNDFKLLLFTRISAITHWPPTDVSRRTLFYEIKNILNRELNHLN